MSKRTFAILIIIIIAMSAIMMSNRQDSDKGEAELLLPGLENQLNDITRLIIKGAGNTTNVTLVRGPERWMVEELNHYPADVGMIRKNLIALANASVVEKKTSDPELYSKLGVESIANENATGIELTIEGPDKLRRIIIGKTGIRGNNAYARRPDEAVSLLIAADLNPGSKPIDWAERTIIDIPSGDIARATTTHPDGETVSINKATPEAGNFTLINQPADTELTYANVADSIGAVLANLELDDVTKRADTDIESIQPIVTRFETFDGLIIITNIYKGDTQTLVSFEFTTDTKLTAGFTATDPDTPSTDQAAGKADKLNTRLNKWLFTLPSYKLDELTHHMTDLLKPPE